MPRYIDANNIPFYIRYVTNSEECKTDNYVIAFRDEIDNIPAEDVVEVKHGKWKIIRYDEAHGARIVCDCCGSSHQVGYKWQWTINTSRAYRYCNWCGARMEGLEPDTKGKFR